MSVLDNKAKKIQELAKTHKRHQYCDLGLSDEKPTVYDSSNDGRDKTFDDKRITEKSWPNPEDEMKNTYIPFI